MQTRKPITNHEKSLDIMRRETNRAVANVDFLKRLYKEMMESRKNVSQKS